MGSIVFVPEIYYKTETVRMDAKKALTYNTLARREASHKGLQHAEV